MMKNNSMQIMKVSLLNSLGRSSEHPKLNLYPSHVAGSVACVAWRFCRAGRRSGVAAKFAREARENERRSREKNKLLPPQSPRGFSALARLYYLVRPTKTAMLRRLGVEWMGVAGRLELRPLLSVLYSMHSLAIRLLQL